MIHRILDLQTYGLVDASYSPALRAAVQKTASSWIRFCALPKEVKQEFIYTDEGNLDGAGYELKEEKASTKDLKENFHVTLKAHGNLAATARRVNLPEAFWFIDDARETIDLITPVVLDFAQSVEKEFNLPGFAEEVSASRRNWFLRYLHYFGNRQAGEEIATPHADKSGFTLHLYESAKGLEFLALEKTGNSEAFPTGTRKWYPMPMPVSPLSTVIIPGMQLQYKSQGQLKALCHRVVATNDTAKTGRYSAVCFIPFLNTPMFNKSALGRLQEFAPGFNYDLPHSEFSKMFA